MNFEQEHLKRNPTDCPKWPPLIPITDKKTKFGIERRDNKKMDVRKFLEMRTILIYFLVRQTPGT